MSLQLDLTGKTALITGAGRGIGRSIARKLSQMGANIVINDIAASQDADAAAQELIDAGGNAICLKGDVRNFEEIEKIIQNTLDKFGRIDILVNNAGITKDGLMMRMSDSDWDDVLDINLKGAFHMIKAVSRPMMKQRSGTIINLASVVGVMGNPGQANYVASKAGLIGLTKTTAKELSSRGITCNAVAPGFIRSAMTDKLSEEVQKEYFKAIPLGRFGEVEDVANVVAFLASDLAKYVTGQVIHIDGGLVM